MTSPRPLPTKPSALYLRVVKGEVAALDALLANPSVDYHTWINSVYTVFHAVGLCKDLLTQQKMLERLSERWPAGHDAWVSGKGWSESVMSNIDHFRWYVTHGVPVNQVTGEGRCLLSQVVLGSPERTTPESMANGMALFDHLRATLSTCQGDMALLDAFQWAVIGVHVDMMEKVLSVADGKIDVNQLMKGGATVQADGTLVPRGMDPVHALMDAYRSYGSDSVRPKYDRAFDILHRHGLDWDKNPEGSFNPSRYDVMVSGLGERVGNEWYRRLRAQSLEARLPSPTPVRRSPRF